MARVYRSWTCSSNSRIAIIRRVSSPRLKLLFDIYHVQVMDGDVIKRIRQYHEFIGHVHTAGNPGRGELDQSQEINFPAIMHMRLYGMNANGKVYTMDAALGLNQ